MENPDAQPRVPMSGSNSSDWLLRKILPIVGVTALAWSLLAAFLVYAL